MFRIIRRLAARGLALRACAALVFGLATAVSAQPVLTINGINADYKTTHVFVDEVNNVTVPLTVVFQPNVPNLTKVETFSNLNNRDRATNDANGDGIPDGILPPDGNLVVAGQDTNYYTAYTMSNTAPGVYQVVLTAAKTGAYRLTTRYQVAGNTNWVWYDSFYDTNGQAYRDFAIVVSPLKAQQLVMYELDVMNANAQGTNQGQQSTFVDLWNGPGSFPSNSTANVINLNYLTNLGVNTLWVQPIHPIGIVGRDTNPSTGQAWNVGSPYSIKNYYAVNPLMSKANTRPAAMTEFSNFVAQADAAGVNIFLDVAFNHTSFDCEFDTNGVAYFATNASPPNSICDYEARFYSLTNSNNGGADYCERAYSAASIPLAPDRGDFAKWVDVHDIYFGYYAALVCDNPSDNNNYLNEWDWFDYTTTNASGHANFDGITQNVWKYFADYVPYWLDQTGCPLTPRPIKATRESTACGPTSPRACRRNAGNTSSTWPRAANGIFSSSPNRSTAATSATAPTAISICSTRTLYLTCKTRHRPAITSTFSRRAARITGSA